MKISRDLAKLVLSWVINETKFHKKVPKLRYYKKYNSPNFGYYSAETQTIHIYEKAHLEEGIDSFTEFIDTIFHEFAHHVQYTSKVFYKRISKKVKVYPDHPVITETDIENDAERFAKKYYKKFLKIIK